MGAPSKDFMGDVEKELITKTDARYDAMVARQEADAEVPASSGERTPSLEQEVFEFSREEAKPKAKAAKK